MTFFTETATTRCGVGSTRGAIEVCLEDFPPLIKIVLFALAALPAFAQNATFRANNYSTNCVGTASLLTGDFDGDGKLDVALQCDGQINIFPGTGAGTLLAPRVGFVIPNRPTPPTGEVVVAADFNHDGKTD